MNELVLGTDGIYEGSIAAGLRLAATPEAQGGWKEYFSESDAGDLRMENDTLRAHTAVMLENAKRWMATKCRRRLVEGRMVIDEATRSAMVGGYADYIFPIIRAAFPSNPINDLVSVQPTSRRTAQIMYWNWIIGRSKGAYTQGEKLFDAQTGWRDVTRANYTGERIDGEPVTPSGAALTASGGAYTLIFNTGGGIRPSTVRITIGTDASATAAYLVDDGQGNLILVTGDDAQVTAVAASTVNYATGAVSIGAITDGTSTTNAGLVSYTHNSEGSPDLAEIDVQITTSTVEAERRAVKLNYSMEAMQDIMAEMGVSLEPQLLTGAAEALNVETARQIISEIWAAVADPGTSADPAVFDVTVPSGISQGQHFRDLMYTLTVASNNIHAATQKGYGNWLIGDTYASSLVESLPDTVFKKAPKPANVQGLHYIGLLNGQWRFYKDIFMGSLPNTSALGHMLMGFKGSQFFEAGYVYSPYQMLYSTAPITLADMVTQKGMATRYATKMVNPAMFTRVNLHNVT